MALFARTRGLFSLMCREIKSISFWTNIVVQSIFFAFYGYSIFNHIENVPFLIGDCLLLTLSTTSFIVWLVTYEKQIKDSKTFYRFIRVTKYLVNATLLVLNVIEMLSATASTSDLSKLMLIVSGIALLVSVIVEFIRIFAEKYIELFTRALEVDFDFLKKLEKAKEVKGNFFEMIDAPLEAIANKLENKQPEISPIDKILNEVAADFDEDLKEKTKQRSEENAQKQKKEIGEHFKVITDHIFKKK